MAHELLKDNAPFSKFGLHLARLACIFLGMSQNTTRTLLIILIMGVALFLRLRYLGEIEHNVDHAYTVWQAISTLDRGTLPLAGQGTSVLFANPVHPRRCADPFAARSLHVCHRAEHAGGVVHLPRWAQPARLARRHNRGVFGVGKPLDYRI